MSELDKAQVYDVYDYPLATRPNSGPDFSVRATHQAYPANYVTSQAQAPSGPHQPAAGFNSMPVPHQYNTHDTAFYSQQDVQISSYLESAPRQLPRIISHTPNRGNQGTEINVYFRSIHDFDSPEVKAVLMFGQKRCESVLQKTAKHGQMFQYALSANVPALSSTRSPSPTVSLHLMFDDSSVSWESPSLEFGSFTYVEQPAYYPVKPPPGTTKKRRLSLQASPRRSPTKKPSLQHLAAPPSESAMLPALPNSPFRQPSVPEAHSQTRRFSGAEFRQTYSSNRPRVQTQQYNVAQARQTTPSIPTAPSPSWSYPTSVISASRSPSAASISVAGKSTALMPSPVNTPNPPLIRTSTLEQSPTTPGTSGPANQAFNPYAYFPANSKAALKIDGELNAMSEKWTAEEWEVKRRLVQFHRRQSGSVITATFEPVSAEDRLPNSICVSCIWWEEKQECYVTSVDTISLLESLVGVRFTVEEKNRIRRNLEGFRPATVSKTKVNSEEFFKLIMGFPNPKPRNIEKDVKVFPWRVLATALKKIIGKYSASYSSTAGALPTAETRSKYNEGRISGGSIDQQQRPGASPLSTSSKATSRGHTYPPTITTASYPPHAGVSAGAGSGPSAGPPEVRLTVPVSAANQAPSWHQPSANYATDMPATDRGSWDFSGGYLSGPPTAMPHSGASYPYTTRVPSLTGQAGMPTAARFVALQDYEDRSHQTHNS